MREEMEYYKNMINISINQRLPRQPLRQTPKLFSPFNKLRAMRHMKTPTVTKFVLLNYCLWAINFTIRMRTMKYIIKSQSPADHKHM